MTADAKTLEMISIGFCAVVALMIVVPTVFGRRAVFSVWNLFLVGAFLFNGLSGIEAARAVYYVELGSADYERYYVGLLLFYGSATLAYHFMKTPRRLAGKTLMKWPAVTPNALLTPVIMLMGLGVMLFVVIDVPFIGQVARQLGMQAPIAALALAMAAWWRNKTNAVTTAVLVAALLFMPLATLSAGTSRRYLLSGLLAIPIVVEWLYLRYKPTQFRLMAIGLAAAVCLPTLMGFSMVRHSFRKETNLSALDRSTRVLSMLPNAIRSGGSSSGLTGQRSTEIGITLINVCRTQPELLSPLPFFTIVYMLENPIPRSTWPEQMLGPKLESIGTTLPRELGVWSTGYVNWGVNVIGQCYYDGGLHVHVLYGMLMGALMRYADEVLVRKPGNPFVLAVLAAASSQILAWTRGSIEIFSYQIIAGVITVLAIAFVIRTLFGVGHVDARTDHIDDPLQAERAAHQWQWAKQMRWRGR